MNRMKNHHVCFHGLPAHPVIYEMAYIHSHSYIGGTDCLKAQG